MNDLRVVYESPKKCDFLFIKKYLKEGKSVSIIEPFHAFHHKKGFRFFPPHLPAFMQKLIRNGKVSVLKADIINAKEIYPLAANKAVDVVESVYPVYNGKHDILFGYVCEVMGFSDAEYLFKNELCRRLAEFYSVNILLHRIEKCLGQGKILIYPDMNVKSYLYLKRLISKSGQELYEHRSIMFPRSTYVYAFLENLRENLDLKVKLILQTLVSGIWPKTENMDKQKKREFTYGVLIISPRQFEDGRRGPDFFVDNKKIKREDVVYFPVIPLKKSQKRILEQTGGWVVYPAKPGRLFSHFSEWMKLLSQALQRSFLRNDEEINVACIGFFNYFKWLKVLESIKIKHFITHADFGIGSIARNIALNQDRIQTWYFSDSMNFGNNFQDGRKRQNMRHPNWTYLNYDHFVTWDELLVRYFKSHPNSIKKSHVVGCLWSGHIRERNIARRKPNIPLSINLNNFYVLACFDSTYSRNGLTSYKEGITFAKHIFQLVNEIQDILIILKEKKERNLHSIFDPVNGPKLLSIYNMMENHSRIMVYSNILDASELISISDAVISFPFTSTNFEALSVNRPAIWHDPMGYYKETLYGKIGGVTTHTYQELKEKVMAIKGESMESYRNPIPANSPLLDPFRDGKAIERFRDLLISE